MDKQWRVIEAAKSTGEIKKIWDASKVHSSELSMKLGSEYNERFRVKSILLLDELFSRFPKEPKDIRFAALYTSPTDIMNIQGIASRLEMLANKL